MNYTKQEVEKLEKWLRVLTDEEINACKNSRFYDVRNKITKQEITLVYNGNNQKAELCPVCPIANALAKSGNNPELDGTIIYSPSMLTEHTAKLVGVSTELVSQFWCNFDINALSVNNSLIAFNKTFEWLYKQANR